MGGGSRGSMGPLLLVNLVMYVLVLALAGWSLDKFGREHVDRVSADLRVAGRRGGRMLGAGGNDAFEGVAKRQPGQRRLCWAGFLGPHRPLIWRTLEAFIVILTFTQLLCLMLLCAGAVSSSYGPSCRNSGGGSGGSDYGVMSREQRDTTAAANAPPHA
ncbi:hypothetical protein ACMD2_03295 [Ananas comosus]|uniref:Uncharacterized protein n=1 Tax=Ananas comosus TaxID=4615 RepID=A0A199V0Z8_ANACO|nr:hypothetical protein ACMD2_03295 [Ananas comosus]